MATDTGWEVSFFERLGDGLSAISEGAAGALMRLFGSSNERVIRKLGYIRAKDPAQLPRIVPGSLVAQVNDLEEKMRALGEEELKALTPRFRQRLAKGQTLEDLLPE